MLFKFILFLFLILNWHFSFADESIPLKTSPSGSIDFRFKEKVINGKTTYQQVNRPYRSQPIYADFFHRRYGSTDDAIETNLYKDQDLTKLTGTVIIKKKGSTLTGRYKSREGKVTAFEPDFFMGQCKKDRFVAYHNVIDVKGKIAQLGEGPWGKQAWIQSQLIELTKLSLGFQYHGARVTRLDAYWDNYASLQTYDEETMKYLDYKMPVQSVLNEFPQSELEFLCDDLPFRGRYEEEPMVVNLLPAGFASNKNSEQPNSDSREVFGCKFIHDNFNSSYDKLNVTIDKPVDDIFLTYDYSRTIVYPLKESDTLYYFSNLKPKSSPIIFTVSQDKVKRLSVFRSEVVGKEYNPISKKITSIALKSTEKFITHKFKFTDAPKESVIKLYISNYELGQIDPAKSLEMELGPGTYPMKMIKWSPYNETTEEHFNLIVSAQQMDQLIDLSKVPSYQHFYLSFNEKKGEIYSPPNDIMTRSVDKLSYVTDQVIDLTNYLVPNKLETKGREELAHLLKKLGAGSVVAEGTCVSTLNLSFHTVPIRSKPDEASDLLGFLKLRRKDERSNMTVSFLSQDGNVKTFSPSLYTGDCEIIEKTISIHQVNKVKGEWSDLGRGPWGESGWVKIKATPLFETDLVLESKKIGIGFFKKKSDETYTFISKEYYGMDFEELKPRDVPRSEVINKEGELLLEMSCMVGC